MRRYTRIAVAVLVAATLSTPASAALITWHVPGYLDDAPEPLSPYGDYLKFHGMQGGQLIDFYLTMDTGVPDLCESPDVGFYRGATLRFTWNGHTGTSGPEPFYIERSFHSLFGNCAFDPDNTMLLRAPVGGEGIPFYYVIFLWPSASPGDDLLLTPPPDGSFYVGLSPLAGAWRGDFGPASVVPEPATVSLLTGGLAAGMALRRRRRR